MSGEAVGPAHAAPLDRGGACPPAGWSATPSSPTSAPWRTRRAWPPPCAPPSSWAERRPAITLERHTPGVPSAHGLPGARTLSPSKVSSFTDCALGLPLLGHRPAARAAHRRRHQGHAGARRARAPPLLPPGRAHPRRRGSPASTTRPPSCATTPSTPALGLDRRRRGRASTPRRPTWCATTSGSRTRRTVRAIGLELQGRGRDRRHPPARHHRPARARRRRRAGRHRLQDRLGPLHAVRAQAPVGRAHLLVAVRADARAAPAHGAAALPARRRSPSPPTPPTGPPGAPAAPSAPSGRPSSGRASARTSARSGPGCATAAPSRPTAPRSAATRRGPPAGRAARRRRRAAARRRPRPSAAACPRGVPGLRRRAGRLRRRCPARPCTRCTQAVAPLRHRHRHPGRPLRAATPTSTG